MTTDLAASAGTEPEVADPDAPIPCTLTAKAETYLDALTAQLSPAEPEQEAGP